MLRKEEEKEREREKKQTNKQEQSLINYKENTGTKLITNTKKLRFKNLEQSLEFQKYNVKEKKGKKKQSKKIIKKYMKFA